METRSLQQDDGGKLEMNPMDDDRIPNIPLAVALGVVLWGVAGWFGWQLAVFAGLL